MIIKLRHTGLIRQAHSGLTLAEILVAITIIAILAAGLYSVSNYIEKQAQTKLTESTIEILSTAIEQYHDFYDRFPFQADKNYGKPNLQTDVNGVVVNKIGTPLSASDYNDIYASSEALYYFLNKFPAGKEIVGSLNSSLLTNKGYKNKEYFIRFGTDTTNYPLIHIIDSWTYPLRYTCKDGDNFPVIISAGPDKDFNTPADNISSK
jgi:prepilin-type N-terminal cleavage/methylation domain-containing protein